jgi:hypothetical protein
VVGDDGLQQRQQFETLLAKDYDPTDETK